VFGVLGVMQACGKFDVTIAPRPLAGTEGRYQVSVTLIGPVQYDAQDSYTMSILALVRILKELWLSF